MFFVASSLCVHSYFFNFASFALSSSALSLNFLICLCFFSSFSSFPHRFSFLRCSKCVFSERLNKIEPCRGDLLRLVSSAILFHNLFNLCGGHVFVCWFGCIGLGACVWFWECTCLGLHLFGLHLLGLHFVWEGCTKRGGEGREGGCTLFGEEGGALCVALCLVSGGVWCLVFRQSGPRPILAVSGFGVSSREVWTNKSTQKQNIFE